MSAIRNYSQQTAVVRKKGGKKSMMVVPLLEAEDEFNCGVKKIVVATFSVTGEVVRQNKKRRGTGGWRVGNEQTG